MTTPAKKIVIEQGANNLTRVEGDRVIKTKNPNTMGIFERSYDIQAQLWNEYYAGTSYATAVVTPEGALSTPYIDGRYPSPQEHLAGCEDLLKKQFVMGDCRDKRNFLVKNGNRYPVDFGQMYTPSAHFYQVNKMQFLKQKKEIEHTIEKEQQRNVARFSKLETYLMRLESYKDDKLSAQQGLTQQKKDVIEAFINDTRARIVTAKQGHPNAFNDYETEHAEAINLLKTNRTTRPLWKSIAVTLITGIIPALLAGAIQATITQGNSFLFFNKQTKSGRLADDVMAEATNVAALKK